MLCIQDKRNTKIIYRLLLGFTAILGALIDMPAFLIVWWRVLITSSSLLFLVEVIKLLRTLPRQGIINFAGIGVIVAAHLVTFYGAILKNKKRGSATTAPPQP